MATLATRIALATSLPAFLVGPTAAMGNEQRLPTSKEVGQALVSAEYERCLSSNESRPIARSHCTTDMKFPTSVTFEQVLCVDYGADGGKNPIARCVFKGQQRIYPNPVGYILEKRRGRKVNATPQKSFPSQTYGDGAIDLIYKNGDWQSIPEPTISFE
jgi:hypothetical protein